MNLRAACTIGLACAVILCLHTTASAGDEVDYHPVKDFPSVPGNVELDACSGVDVDDQGRVYLFHRGKSPIMCFDAKGHFLHAWGDDHVNKAHGLRIGPDGNIWTTDVGNHLVCKFTPEGKLLLKLGQKDKPGLGLDQFNRPTDIAFGPDNVMYISDGYGNSRVMKFTQEGEFLKTWGEPGTKPGQFDTPHTVVVNDRGWVLVGDRENERVQIFDPEGQLINIWSGFKPFGLDYDPGGTLFVADGKIHQVLRLSQGGEITRRWGKEGSGPGEYKLPHMIAADGKGNLYVTEILGKRMQKLERVAEPSS